MEILSALHYEALTSTVNGLALIKVSVCGQERGGEGGGNHPYLQLRVKLNCEGRSSM